MRISVKYLFLIVFVISVSFASAQESLMQSVNNAYLQKLIDTAKVYYPKYKTFNHRINIALEDVKKAKLSWFDLITFSLTYSPNNSTTIMTPTLTGYQVGMFFNVGNLIVKPHTIKQAKEEVAIATLNKQEYDLNIEAEVKSRYYKYIQYLAALKIENESIIDIEAILKQAKYRFEKGEETLENYSKAIIAFNAQKQNIVSAEGYVLIAKSSLEEIIGKKLEDIH